MKTINDAIALLAEHNPDLTEISIHIQDSSPNQITELFAKLAQNPQLTHLTLSGCPQESFTGDVSDYLEQTTQLKVLEIEYAKINYEQVVHLSRGLTTNNSLEVLNLRNNHLGYMGADYIVRELQGNQIKVLDFSNNQIDRLAKDFKGPIEVALTKLNDAIADAMSTGEISDHLDGFYDEIRDSLQQLRIGKMPSISMALQGLEHIKACLKLTTGSPEQLENINQAILAFEAALNTEINFFADSFQGSSLEVLKLNSNHLGDVWIAALARSLKDCQTFKALHLENNAIGYIGMGQLVEVLKNCHTLQALYLAMNQLGTKGAWNIADLLMSGVPLERLDLSWNDITGEGVLSLASTLEHKRWLKLKELHLSGNPLMSSGQGGLSALGFIKLFSGQSPVECLYLSYLDFPLMVDLADSFRQAFQVLARNSTLRVLDFSHNQMGPLNGYKLAHALYQPYLEELIYLAQNGMAADDAVQRKKSCLETINLEQNSLDAEAALMFLNMCALNPRLNHLNLRANGLGTLRAVAAQLANNYKELDKCNTDAFIEKLSSLCGHKTIDLTRNNFSLESELALARYCEEKENHALCILGIRAVAEVSKEIQAYAAIYEEAKIVEEKKQQRAQILEAIKRQKANDILEKRSRIQAGLMFMPYKPPTEVNEDFVFPADRDEEIEFNHSIAFPEDADGRLVTSAGAVSSFTFETPAGLFEELYEVLDEAFGDCQCMNASVSYTSTSSTLASCGSSGFHQLSEQQYTYQQAFKLKIEMGKIRDISALFDFLQTIFEDERESWQMNTSLKKMVYSALYTQYTGPTIPAHLTSYQAMIYLSELKEQIQAESLAACEITASY